MNIDHLRHRAVVTFSLVLGLLGGGCGEESTPGSAPPAAVLLAQAPGTDEDFAFSLSTGTSRAAVWAVWTDVPCWPRWDIVEAASLEGDFALDAQGTTGQGRISPFAVTEFTDGASYTLTLPIPDGALVIRRSFEPGEATVFTHRVQFTGPGGAAVASSLGPGFRAALPGVMDRVRQLAEGSP